MPAVDCRPSLDAFLHSGIDAAALDLGPDGAGRRPGSSRAHACRRPADAGANQHHDPAGQSTHRGGGNDPPPCRSAEGHGYGTAIATTMDGTQRSEEHTSELQSLMRISYAVICFKNKT